MARKDDGWRNIFQLSPRREGRPSRILRSLSKYYFNSRPYVRGDHCFCRSASEPVYFNSRPYVRGDRTKSQLML